MLTGYWPAPNFCPRMQEFFFSDGNFTEVYSSDTKQQVPLNMDLNDFCNGVVIPEKLKSDRAPECFGRKSEFLEYAKQKGIYLTYAEPDRRNKMDPIDVEIRDLRKRTHKK